MLSVIGAAVVGHPGVTNGELVEAQHVQHSNLGNGCTKKLRPLVDACGHQKATVGATLDCKFFAARVTLFDEEFARSLEVVEDILLVEEAACIVPRLTIFSVDRFLIRLFKKIF